MSNAEIAFVGAAFGLITGVVSALAISALLRRGPRAGGGGMAPPLADVGGRLVRLILLLEPLVLAVVGGLIAYWVFGVH